MTKTITKTKQNKEEQIKSKEHIILKMLHRCLSAVISPTTNFMQTWITLQKSGKFFVLLQFKMIVWQWYTFIPYERSPPTPPLLLTQTRHVVDKKQKGRKNKFYNFSLVHCQFIIKLLLWTMFLMKGAHRLHLNVPQTHATFFFLLISRFCEWTKEKRNLIFIYLFSRFVI